MPTQLLGKKFLDSAKILCKKRLETLAAKTEFERKYVSLDNKGETKSPFDDTLKLYDLQLSALKTEMGMMFGSRGLSITLPAEVDFQSTITTGVINGTSGISPNGFSDFAACVALFDEFRVKSFVYEFSMPGVVAPPAPNVFSDTALIMVYAPADNTAFAGSATSAALQYENHKLYVQSQNPTNGASQTTLPHGTPLKFEGKIPDGILSSFASGTTPVSVGEGNWQATNSATLLPYGFIKLWSTAGVRTASVPCVFGALYLHCEFRIRI